MRQVNKEMQAKSTYQQTIGLHAAMYSDALKAMGTRVATATLTNFDDILALMTDAEALLGKLEDEGAVLKKAQEVKSFAWPDKRFGQLRVAMALDRELRELAAKGEQWQKMEMKEGTPAVTAARTEMERGEKYLKRLEDRYHSLRRDEKELEEKLKAAQLPTAWLAQRTIDLRWAAMAPLRACISVAEAEADRVVAAVAGLPPARLVGARSLARAWVEHTILLAKNVQGMSGGYDDDTDKAYMQLDERFYALPPKPVTANPQQPLPKPWGS